MKGSLREASQTPIRTQIFLDHVGWFVSDMNMLSTAMERLGLKLTPFVAQFNEDPGGAPIPAGTGNRCAILKRGYLEFLTTIPNEDTPLSKQLHTAVKKYQGLHLIALSVDNPKGAFTRLNTLGFKPLEPVNLRRPLELQGGEKVEVAFTVLRVPPNKMEEGRIQILRQDTPHLVWRKELISEENENLALGSVVLVVRDPKAVANRFSKFCGKKAIGSAEYQTIDLDRGRLAFFTPEKYLQILPGVKIPSIPYIGAVGIQCKNLEFTENYLSQKGIAMTTISKSVKFVRPKDAGGSAIAFYGDNSVWPTAVQ